ncbi:MAG: prepilin-type N-terminal cleavage/methylation domain-containing protein [Burkholderiaceae bacterium]|nr:prepilin-type N-terminal cleavage/methylation domain-containing protein [Burkholderiaceae bacterium]MCX8006128.1 prepilin-type N-terminal cleavage/methylation domain-containing protein [Burkholderiaceae bacterium]
MQTMSDRQRAGKGGAAPRGFTLIELVVAMVVIAILAAVAIPIYAEYIRRGHRADARAALLLAAQWQERFRSENNAYAAALPAAMGQVPASGTARYLLTVDRPGGPQTYLLTATRTGPQAGDDCGDFTLDHLGARGTVNGTLPANRCWSQ